MIGRRVISPTLGGAPTPVSHRQPDACLSRPSGSRPAPSRARSVERVQQATPRLRCTRPATRPNPPPQQACRRSCRRSLSRPAGNRRSQVARSGEASPSPEEGVRPQGLVELGVCGRSHRPSLSFEGNSGTPEKQERAGQHDQRKPSVGEDRICQADVISKRNDGERHQLRHDGQPHPATRPIGTPVAGG